jgi:DNA-binding ferritin-like protein
MNEENLKREIAHVVRRVLPLVHKHTSIGKKKFEDIHAEIQCMHENTGTSMDAIAEKMHTVLEALPTEYGRLSEEQRSWEALIWIFVCQIPERVGQTIVCSA